MRRLFKVLLLVSNLVAFHLLFKTDDVDARIISLIVLGATYIFLLLFFMFSRKGRRR